MREGNSKPNSDLAVNEEDEVYLRSQYPNIAEHLVWPELRDAFKAHETSALLLKKSSRHSSFGAIAFVTASLTLTLIATSALFQPTIALVPNLNKTIAAMSVTFLVLALLLGKGVMFGRKRDNWLRHRLAAERIRHLYFQYLLSNFDKVCGTDVISRRSFFEAREKVLNKALKRIEHSSYVQTVRDDQTLRESRLLDFGRIDSVPTHIERYHEFIAFWEEFRLEWQENYTTDRVKRNTSSFPLFGSLADQDYTIGTLEFLFTVGIVILQIIAVGTQLFGSSVGLSTQLSVLAASVLAVFVVGLHAYRDGVGLTADISRNRVYGSYTSKIHFDFQRAVRRQDVGSAFRAMKEMEDLAYFETREFLNAHSQAQFSL
ncbi:hypothetical protein GI582_26060 [Sulfitobacter sp. BDSS02]|nr:hypothetical protein [Sulfitobacter sp. BDSS02]